MGNVDRVISITDECKLYLEDIEQKTKSTKTRKGNKIELNDTPLPVK